ncbi:helix-turn-helix protein [Neomoorella glycerini]|uniref:Helix-turn-helix protein n=1 Tax=Neomoorella glycerini TaxID=55779 RepID=A0A6I5ZMP4_9FIRM|nr:helix-turn-helix transcriptional regulator [Moorella glycerini]QGP90885.1 helix-turn-helix protein [Moorella glycerini]
MKSKLGARLRYYRTKRYLTLRQVEDLTGLHSTTISSYERGTREPSQETLRILAKAYNIHVAYLLLDEAEINRLLEEKEDNLAVVINQRPEIAELVNELTELQPPAIKALVNFIKHVKQSWQPRDT